MNGSCVSPCHVWPVIAPLELMGSGFILHVIVCCSETKSLCRGNIHLVQSKWLRRPLDTPWPYCTAQCCLRVFDSSGSCPAVVSLTSPFVWFCSRWFCSNDSSNYLIFRVFGKCSNYRYFKSCAHTASWIVVRLAINHLPMYRLVYP